MSSSSHILRGLFTLALLAVIALAGQIPWGSPSEDAALRLALRTVDGKVRTCRDRTAEELAALPQHMRTPTLCEDRSVDYQLRVTLDGAEVLDLSASPGGLRRDRPIIVDRQVAVAAGPQQLSVRFIPVHDPDSDTEPAASEALPAYAIDRMVDFAPGRIVLVTLDDADHSLEIVQQ